MYFKDYVGQNKVVAQLQISVASAKKLNKALEHCLFLGPPGVGKSSLAKAVIGEMGYNCVILNPLMLKNTKDFFHSLKKVRDNSIIFIDEIHELNRDCVEALYSLMQDKFIDFIADGSPIKINYNNITVIGATTELHLLPKALIDRFTFKFFLTEYTNFEMVSILGKELTELNEIYGTKIKLSSMELLSIATLSKLNPRIAKNLIKLIVDEFAVTGRVVINDVCLRNNIYPLGLDAVDISILKVLSRCKDAVGFNSLSSLTGFRAAVLDSREPYLLHLKFIERSSKGRTLTDEGRSYILNNVGEKNE